MKPLILVTGASGYIASRLIPRLLDQGYRVRAMAREPARLAGRAWLTRVEVVRGNTIEPASLATALEGVQSAYYLIHSMARGRGYAQIERESARRFAVAAEAAEIEHIIYLGGLADPRARNIAPHMRSRIETGEVLRQGRVPVTEFRAGVIVGAGSISFEMIRFLTECFPIMPGPNWLHNRVQPIAASNVIDYLVAALDQPQARGGIYDVGGPDVMLYSDTMLRYARARGLRRRLFTLPGIPIALMARVVDWLTPVPFAIATPLVGGLQSDSIVLDNSAQHIFGEAHLLKYEQSVREAMDDLVPPRLERVWEGFGRDVVHMKHEGFFIDYRRLNVKAPVGGIYAIFSRIGGHNGWVYANWLWRLRGWVDHIISPYRRPADPEGVELKPGSDGISHPATARREGDRVDYYRVEELEADRMLRLHSELRAPGEGWMEWRVESLSPETSALTQTVFFAPRGLSGFLYWYLLAPVHRLVFNGLIRGIKKRSEGS